VLVLFYLCDASDFCQLHFYAATAVVDKLQTDVGRSSASFPYISWLAAVAKGILANREIATEREGVSWGLRVWQQMNMRAYDRALQWH